MSRAAQAFQAAKALFANGAKRGIHEGQSGQQSILMGTKHIGKESGAFSRLEQAGPIPEANGAGSAAAADRKMDQSSSGSVFIRAQSFIGNFLFYGILGGSSVVGYYTYFYDQQQLQALIDSRKDAFPGSSIWCQTMQWYLDKRKYFEGEMRSFANPRQDKLLPDARVGGHEKTLVLDLDELLIHSDWTRQRGWKVFKRHGAEDFFKAMAPYYEIVVYSHQHHTYVDPIMDQLDPHHIALRLYRADTRYEDGKHVRDLSKLNRDMSKVLFLSANAEAYALQPDNAIKLKPWHKDQGDTMLLDLIPFLQYLAFKRADVRDVVRAYDDCDIPSTFRARMQQMEAKKVDTKGKKGFLSTIARQ
ncbi:unnamed protein product [Ostreobium quekettii]|uniref:Mitochondrial import inner membrane translocase subunit TIM50 n=1 Tax=Ostreobium quekettii TaxID=121088 RepID=A0A8S1IK09_9CHLO|nr:unnamed protein product [Ostreobium quekettii]|eukprot:evm.model.scf_2412.2 EVM.evm.TU.scf_2412.2   scf_2412:3818-5607(+)